MATQETPKRYVCQACGAGFDTEEELERHNKDEHGMGAEEEEGKGSTE